MEPEWDRLRGLWTELEFTNLLRQIPARAVTLPAGTVPVVDATGWREFVARAGSRLPTAALRVRHVYRVWDCD